MSKVNHWGVFFWALWSFFLGSAFAAPPSASPFEGCEVLDPLPQNVYAIGASITDGMGGPTAFPSKIGMLSGLIIRADTPMDQIARALGLKGTPGYRVDSLFDTGTGFVLDKIGKWPTERPQGEKKPYDLVFVLDSFYKEFKHKNYADPEDPELRETALDPRLLETPQDDRATRRGKAEARRALEKSNREKKELRQSLKETYDRIVAILDRLSANARIAIVGTPVDSELGEKNGRPFSRFLGPRKGVAMLQHILETEPRYSNILLYDLERPYRELRFTKMWTYHFQGDIYLLPADQVLSGDDWHPSNCGNERIANQMIERLLERHPCWGKKLSFLDRYCR